jgi:OOP family OmpA-OmpF porin
MPKTTRIDQATTTRTALKAMGAAAVLFILGACAEFTAGPELTALRNAELPERPFERALVQEYLALASFEADEMMDWRYAQRFTRKGLATLAGNTAAPTDPARWRIPKEHRATLANARLELTLVLDNGARDRAPSVAAAAQTNFDCWVEQQEENWQWDHIAACRTGFETAMAMLRADLAASAPPALPREPVAVAEIVTPGSPPDDGPIRLFFDFDSYLLDGKGLAALRIAAAQAQTQAVTLVVIGHADRAGSEPYNWDLSLDRADAVRGALAAMGVPARLIAVRAAGETEPLVATADGVRERQNRRVEIVLRPRDGNLAQRDPRQFELLLAAGP